LARSLHADDGLPFLEVWVSTPAEECARRDPKGLYARARRGEIEGLTGVDAPYEEPEHPDLEIGGNVPVDLAAGRVLSAVGAG
jgi:adenylylsulfate kinase-like enzyme